MKEFLQHVLNLSQADDVFHPLASSHPISPAFPPSRVPAVWQSGCPAVRGEAGTGSDTLPPPLSESSPRFRLTHSAFPRSGLPAGGRCTPIDIAAEFGTLFVNK